MIHSGKCPKCNLAVGKARVETIEFFVTASGGYIADRAICHTFNFGKHLVGDWASGNIYDLSSNYFDDAGTPIRGNRRTPTVAKENQWIYYEQIEFVMETGLAPTTPLFDGDGQPRPPQLNVSRGESYKGVSYLCPFCRAILGVQMDPLAVNLNLLNRLLAILGRD